MGAWLVQIIACRSARPRRTPVDLALFAFFALCVVSSFLSYEPLVSVKGLRSPAFFLAFYFVANSVSSVKFARTLALIVVGSCLLNVAYSGIRLWSGQGVRIDRLEQASPLSEGDLQSGDIILQADGLRVNSLEELSQIVDSNRGPLQIVFQRKEAVSTTTVSRRAIKLAAGDGAERLGISSSRGRAFRVTGFYNHYETYAEVLQMIASLAAGLLISYPRKRSLVAFFLAISIGLIVSALVMTSTRASIAGFVVSLITIAAVSLRRRVAILALLLLIVFVPAALLAVERSRGISFIDFQEGSTAYRLAVWGEALRLIERHPIFGIGKGSEGSKSVREAFGLYDDGKLPPGHFHSTPIQIATWWGLPALAFYLALMTVLLIECWRLARLARSRGKWNSWGVALGAMGAIVAFNVSSLVHFNFGDGEVVMVLWLMAGLAFAVRRIEIDDARLPESSRLLPDVEQGGPQEEQFQEQKEAVVESSSRVAAVRRN